MSMAIKKDSKIDIVSTETIGECLIEFLSNITYEKTKIGELQVDRQANTRYLIGGYMTKDNMDPCNLLFGLSTSIDCSDKFSSYSGRNALSILNETLNTPQYYGKDYSEIRSRLLGINNNQLLVTPIREGNLINYGNNFSKSIKVECLKWNNRGEGNTIKCTIMPYKEAGSGEKLRFNLEDYGKTYMSSSALTLDAVYPKDINIIKMKESGIIQPIKIIGTNKKGIKDVLIFDNKYMYTEKEGITIIAGIWRNGEIIEVAEGELGAYYKGLLEKFRKYTNFIHRHKNYIAPYGLMSSNNIEWSK